MFHNSNKSKLLTLIKFMFNCSTYYLGLLASKLTAVLPFSMRTSSCTSQAVISCILFQFYLYSKLSRYESFHLKEVSKICHPSSRRDGFLLKSFFFFQRFFYYVKNETTRNSPGHAKEEKSPKHKSVKG